MKITMKLLKVLAVCSLPVLLSGCSSLMCGRTQTVPLTSSPPKATITVYNEFNDVLFTGTTPCNVNLRRSTTQGEAGYYKIIFRKEGYAPQDFILTGRKNRAYFANIPFGVVGMIAVDPVTGAMWTLSPMEGSAKLKQNVPSATAVAKTKTATPAVPAVAVK